MVFIGLYQICSGTCMRPPGTLSSPRVTAPYMALINPMAFHGSAAEKPPVQPTRSACNRFTTRNRVEP